jgi:hypothetical protein
MIYLPTKHTLLSEAVAAWLRTFCWTHLVTLTFKNIVEEEFAERRMKAWIRKLEKVSEGRVNWVFSIERQGSGNPHLHLLLGLRNGLQIEQLVTAWKDGFAKIRRYDPGRGGAYYVVKTIGDHNDNWAFNLKGLEKREPIQKETEHAASSDDNEGNDTILEGISQYNKSNRARVRYSISAGRKAATF